MCFTLFLKSADGNYEITIMTKAIIHPDGLVIWRPPAIYKSSCQIDIEFFPFDQQVCFMKFGSWTYDGHTVSLLKLRKTLNNCTLKLFSTFGYRSFVYNNMSTRYMYNPCLTLLTISLLSITFIHMMVITTTCRLT